MVRKSEARGRTVTIDPDSVWAAVTAVEDEYGETAEAEARRQAEICAAAGDAVQAAIWEAAANNLHTLHTINRQWARPERMALFPQDRDMKSVTPSSKT